jgi:hypothetical protein
VDSGGGRQSSGDDGIPKMIDVATVLSPFEVISSKSYLADEFDDVQED